MKTFNTKKKSHFCKFERQIRNSYSLSIISLSKITSNLPFVLRASKIHIFSHNFQIPRWHKEKHISNVTGCLVRKPFLFLVYFKLDYVVDVVRMTLFISNGHSDRRELIYRYINWTIFKLSELKLVTYIINRKIKLLDFIFLSFFIFRKILITIFFR